MEHGCHAIIRCIGDLIALVRDLPWVEGLRQEFRTRKFVRSYSVGKREMFDINFKPLTEGD